MLIHERSYPFAVEAFLHMVRTYIIWRPHCLEHCLRFLQAYPFSYVPLLEFCTSAIRSWCPVNMKICMQLGSCPQNRIWPIFNLYLLHVSYIYHHILKKPTPIIVTTIPKLYQLCLPLRLRNLRQAVTSQCHLCALLATGLLSGRCCWHSR